MKDQFHFAKLSLFNMRLLSEMQDAVGNCAELAEVIEDCTKRNGMTPPVPLLHQAAFLGHAYICLVWLREVVMASSNEEFKKKYFDRISSSYDFDKWIRKCEGPRKLVKARDYIRLVRNAISHGRVTVGDDEFRLADKSNSEKSETVVTLTWEGLARLADASLFSVNERLYPGSNAA